MTRTTKMKMTRGNSSDQPAGQRENIGCRLEALHAGRAENQSQQKLQQEAEKAEESVRAARVQTEQPVEAPSCQENRSPNGEVMLVPPSADHSSQLVTALRTHVTFRVLPVGEHLRTQRFPVKSPTQGGVGVAQVGAWFGEEVLADPSGSFRVRQLKEEAAAWCVM